VSQTFLFALLAISSALGAAPGIAAAATSGGHHDGAPTAGQWLLMLFTCINFVIFVLLFVRFTRVPLRGFFRGRRKEVVDLMAAAAKERAEAEALRKEYEARLAALGATRDELIAEVRRMAEVDGERLIAAAREAADRIRRDAERTAASDVERGIKTLREEAARLATRLATEQVQGRLGPDERKRLLDEFLQGVSRT
jgi:F-type H+-transporting ATPase subunit b